MSGRVLPIKTLNAIGQAVTQSPNNPNVTATGMPQVNNQQNNTNPNQSVPNNFKNVQDVYNKSWGIKGN